MHILPTTVSKLLRHTGARPFVWSSAVGNHCAVFGYIVEMLLKLFGRNSDSVRQLSIRFLPCRRVARIYKGKLLPTIHPFLYFIDCDPSCLNRLHKSSL